ncbi:MAG: YifB family Mg chelatase-like AAA ATPase [Oscillospiraceae bacterium]|nr:YifB family Mg chelatase-like AAA ATPase [Oscillospiraceae bacterium]
MYSKINAIGLYGLNAFGIEVEADISRGLPSFDIVGFPDNVVRESRERIKAAAKACEINLPVAKITINLAPADTKKSGTSNDLPILMSILCAIGLVKNDLSDCAFVGELALNGDVRPINGVLPMVLLAAKYGIKKIFVPFDNAYEASVADNIEIYGIKNLSQLLAHLNGSNILEPAQKYTAKSDAYEYPLDFKDVKGQANAKKALEIAAAGGHNALLIGAPGSGKSMLAKRMPSILPKMTFEESIETTMVYSISGMLDNDTPLITRRPFRAPHHTVSSAGLAGGGSIPHPGEISLAHNGLLFLDELAEFDRRTLEILRQPLEDGIVTISRSSGTVSYPSNIMLIAAMNPCPCGYFGNLKRRCTCTERSVKNYLAKISGPLLDRFDLHVDVAPVEYENLTSKNNEESSDSIRRRVEKAREIQYRRYKGTSIVSNSNITSDIISEVCTMSDDAEKFLKAIFEKLCLSARAYDRILKVSRTIADLNGIETIEKAHLAQAVSYRSLDKKYWGNQKD